MLLVLNNPRYSFLKVLPSANNATGPEKPQVQLFNNASFCTQCFWPLANLDTVINCASPEHNASVSGKSQGKTFMKTSYNVAKVNL
jgi:hypothetical protein